MKKITITLAAALLLFAFVSPAFPQGNILDDAEDFVFFADFVIGSGWTFQIAISNNSPTTYLNGVMGVAVDASDSGGVSFKEALEAGFLPSFTLPPGGTKIYTEWPNVPLDEVIRGGVLVVQLTEFPAFQRDTQMMSAVLTYRNDETKTEITVPPVRFKDLSPPFFNDEVAYSIFVEETDAVTTGLALWKSPDNEVCMGLDGLDGESFQSSEGYDLSCFSPTHDDFFNHLAQLLPEWFPGWDFSGGFQGRLVIAVSDKTFGKGNDGLVIPMGLRANRASGVMSAVPVVPVAIDWRPSATLESSPAQVGKAMSREMSRKDYLDQRLDQLGNVFWTFGH